MNRIPRLAVALAATALPGTVAGQSLAYEGGLGLSSGRYIFDTRTTSLSLTSGLAWSHGRWTLRLALPVVAQNTPLVTASGMGGLPSGGSFGGMVSDSGSSGPMGGMRRRGLAVDPSAARGYAAAVGDPLAHATVQLLRASRVSVRVGAAVKAPLADTATYGTGRWDAGLSVGTTARLGAAVFLDLDASWWRLGDMAEVDFNDPFLVSMSLDRLFGAWSLGVHGSAATAALSGYQVPALVGASLVHGAARRGWGVSVSAGLTETAPDVMVGLTWRLRMR